MEQAQEAGLDEACRALAIDAARRDFGAFVLYVGRDDEGRHVDWRPVDRLAWTFVEESFAAGGDVGVMLPNGFGKSTQANWRVAYEIGRDPNLLCAVVADSEENAALRVTAVRDILKSPAYREVFPPVAIARGREKASAFSVVRSGHSPFDTVTGYGVLTGTGARCSLLVLDDPVTFKNAVQEPANRDRVYQAIRTTWFSRGQRAREGRQRVLWIQTAYHGQDATARIREDPRSGFRFLIVRAEPPFAALSYEKWRAGAVEESGTVPSHLSAAFLQSEWAKQGATAAAQSMANRPYDPEKCPFKEPMLIAPRPLAPSEYERRTVYADPAGDASTSKGRDTDWCAVAAIGRHPERGWELYGYAEMKGKPSEQAAFIAGFAVAMEAEQLWQEATRDDALVEATQQELEARRSALTVQPDKPTSQKEARIVQALEPALTRKRLSICADLWPELKGQLLAFPAGAHDDGPDAVASCWLKAAGAEADAATDRVVTLAMLDAAADAPLPPQVAPTAGDAPPAAVPVHAGFALAGYEGDESAAAVVRGGELVDVETWAGMDLDEAARRVRAIAERHAIPEAQLHVAGAGLGDRLVDGDLGVDDVALSGDPAGDWEEEIDGLVPFRDRRSELLWVTRLLLQAGRLRVPRAYVSVWSDLAAPAYRWDPQGRVRVEGPEDFRRKKERPPVLADAVALALARSGGGLLG